MSGAAKRSVSASPSALPVLFRTRRKARLPGYCLTITSALPTRRRTLTDTSEAWRCRRISNSALSNAERADGDPIHKVRQRRATKADLLRLEIELEAQARLQQRQRRCARPGLRRAGHRIERRPLAERAPEAAEQFRGPTQVHIARRVIETRQEPLSFLSQSVSSEAEADQRVVVRPDRAVVVGHRIVARFGRSDRPDAPASEEVRAQQLLSDRRRSFLRDDAGEQQLTGIGRAHSARTLPAIERERIGPDVFAPERLFEANPEIFSRALQARRRVWRGRWRRPSSLRAASRRRRNPEPRRARLGPPDRCRRRGRSNRRNPSTPGW